MYVEYKRDVSHNYMILRDEKNIDTASYQVRMLAGNVIPHMLKCRMQGLDGSVLFCYDITSRQSVASFFENKKMKGSDLEMIFEGFVRIMEELAEYLMNPEQLLLNAEYMFLDVEKRDVCFCCLPGEGKPVQEQLRDLTEYLLPRLDHQDAQAVMMGYAIYRQAMEPGIQLDAIKEALYRRPEEKAEGDNRQKKSGRSEEELKVDELLWEELERDFQEDAGSTEKKEEDAAGEKKGALEKKRKKEQNKKRGWVRLAACAGSSVFLLGILAAGYLGYLPWIAAEAVIGVGIAALGCAALAMFFSEKKKKKEETAAQWRTKVHRELSRKPLQGKQIKTGMEEETDQEILQEMEDIAAGTEEKMDPLWTSAQEKDREAAAPDGFGETVVLSLKKPKAAASLVSREPGELATIYLEQDLTVVGKLANAADAVIPLATVSRVHARIRKKEGNYYLADLNSRNGTSVNGRMLEADEEYCLADEDQIDFAEARYVFLDGRGSRI